MRLLKEIFRGVGEHRNGKALFREAVRGVIRDGRRLLMVHSTVNGDYKFPGGGVDATETQEQALAREIWEECGARMIGVDGEFGQMIEYNVPLENDYDLFQMTSSYYLCRVHEDLHALRLDDYERDLGFHPVWVDIDEAIRTNRLVLESHDRQPPRWTDRDTFVLEKLKEEYDL